MHKSNEKLDKDGECWILQKRHSFPRHWSSVNFVSFHVICSKALFFLTSMRVVIRKGSKTRCHWRSHWIQFRIQICIAINCFSMLFILLQLPSPDNTGSVDRNCWDFFKNHVHNIEKSNLWFKIKLSFQFSKTCNNLTIVDQVIHLVPWSDLQRNSFWFE